MSERLTATLWSPQQAHPVIQRVWERAKADLLAGKRLRLELSEQLKSRETEEKYHAILGEIYKAMKKAGSDLDREEVKRIFLEQFAEDTGREKGKLRASLDGKRLVQTHLMSRKFTQGDGSEFIEWLHAWCAEHGVELSQ
jgi:hypothetical protein